MIRIPAALIPPLGITIASVIVFVVIGGRIEAASVGLGVIWIMQVVRRQG